MVRIQQARPSKTREELFKFCLRTCYKRRRTMYLLQMLLAFFILWYWWPEITDSEISVHDPEFIKWDYPVANNTRTRGYAKDTRAIVLLSMGREAAASTIVERSVLAIRRIGEYLGPVILLTDSPTKRYRSLTRFDPNFVVMQPLASDWRRDLLQDMPYKRFKTFVLEYLQRDKRLDSIKLLYYLDIDVIVGRPLAPWFHHVETMYLHNNELIEQSKSKSRMIFFKGNSKRRPLQGGQFLMERGSSQQCLEVWRKYIDARPFDPKDQSALTQILEEQNNATATCHLTIMPQLPYLKFLDRGVMQELTATKDYPTLMHLKNTEHASWIPFSIQQPFFEDALRLSKEEVEVIGKIQIHPS